MAQALAALEAAKVRKSPWERCGIWATAGLPPQPAPFWEIVEITNRGMAAYDAGDFVAALSSLSQPAPSWEIMEITNRGMVTYDAGDFADGLTSPARPATTRAVLGNCGNHEPRHGCL